MLLNEWNNTFYNSLQDKNYAVFVQQLFLFTWLAGSAPASIVEVAPTS